MGLVLAASVTILAFMIVPAGGGGPSLGSPGPGSSLYLIGPQGSGLDIGSVAPDLAGPDGTALLDLDGDAISLAGLRGRPVWIVFWATWCPPCQQETPDIERAYEEYADDLVVLAISVQEPNNVVEDYRKTYGIRYRIGLDASAGAMRTYQVFGLPTHYFVDRQGVIRERRFGPLTLEQMRDRIDLISAPAG